MDVDAEIDLEHDDDINIVPQQMSTTVVPVGTSNRELLSQ